MDCQIAKAIKLDSQPVAVIKTDTIPEHALQFKEGKWGLRCRIAGLCCSGTDYSLQPQNNMLPRRKCGPGISAVPIRIEYFPLLEERGLGKANFIRKRRNLRRHT